jgi:PleD family two-component response regulator
LAVAHQILYLFIIDKKSGGSAMNSRDFNLDCTPSPGTIQEITHNKVNSSNDSLIQKGTCTAKVLVIGDESCLFKHFISILTSANFALNKASSFDQALDMLPLVKPDLIILEKTQTDCLKICRRLRAVYSDYIVIIGRDDGDSDWEQAVASGADYYLRMSDSDAVFLARVKAIVRQSRKKTTNLAS